MLNALLVSAMCGLPCDRDCPIPILAKAKTLAVDVVVEIKPLQRTKQVIHNKPDRSFFPEREPARLQRLRQVRVRNVLPRNWRR